MKRVFPEKYIESFDGTRIHYRYKKGSKKCIVFLHGLTGAYSAWPFQEKYFSEKGYSTITIDIRGHGYSDKPNETYEYTIKHAAKDLEEIVKKENINDFTIVSHCMGTYVALKYHELFPHRVRSMVLISPHHKPNKDTMWKLGSILFFLELTLLSFIYKNVQYTQPDFMKLIGMKDYEIWRYLPLIKIASAKTVRSFLKDIMKFDGSLFVAKITIPCLIISGKKDLYIPKKIPTELSRAIKNSTLLLYENEWHNPVLNNPDRICKDIENFIR